LTPETEVALEVFLRWLRQATDRQFLADERGDISTVSDTENTIATSVRTLVPVDDVTWANRVRAMEEAIAEDLPARIALWVPAGADLPDEEPTRSEFLSHVREAAVKLGPTERRHVPLPATLLLRKNADEGGVVSCTGGLNPHWAKFTGRVQGQYDLDSNQVHRLPESDEFLEKLIDQIVEETKGMEPRQVKEITTVDAWTVQRLPGKTGVTIVGVPPAETKDIGLAVRRNFRRALVEAVPPLRAADATLRALLVLGYYPRVEMEGATTAIRGYDPALYSGIDYVCLVTDGIVKPIIQPPAALLPWAKS